jgi:gas vesicle protein
MKHIKRQNYYMGKVKQTAEAALDARVLVFASDLAGKKLKNTLHGNSSVGIDVDQFVSRCIHFMKSGGNPAPHNATPSTQGRHRRRTAAEEDEDDDEDTGEALDWALMGKEACFPFNRRPPVSGFLLGPLSVQKRARASQARRARSQRQPVAPTTRPQELTQADIKQSENSNLPHLVKGIKNRLETHLSENTEKVEAELEEFEGEPDDEDVEAASRRHRVYISPDGEAAANFFDFVINPSSFGQTVENMFYVSFLIKEGNVKIVLKDDMPLLGK